MDDPNVFMPAGFYVSCRRNKECQAFNEITSALQRFIVFDNKVADFRLALQQETDSLTKRYFNKLFGYKNVFYIQNNSAVSVRDLYDKLIETNAKFKYVQRIVPLFDIFQYDSGRIHKALAGLNRTKSYKIVYNEKLCKTEVREKIFSDIVNYLNMKVDLITPEYYVVVEVFKNYVGISVIKDIGSNFNFSMFENNTHRPMPLG